MNEVDIDRIAYDDTQRIRQDLDLESLYELAESIKRVGQLSPIIVDRSFKLLAGRRRLEALRMIGARTVKYEYFDNLGPLEQKIVEFDENHKRRQLTWQEEAKAVAEIHALLDTTGCDKRTPWSEQSLESTAKHLGVSVVKVHEDIALARALSNPRVAVRPSKKGALETLKRERELELVRELASRQIFGLNAPGPGVRLSRGQVANADCLGVLKSVPDESVDLVVTDPPWGINIHTASQWVKSHLGSYADDAEATTKLLVNVIPQLYRVLKPGSHLYIFYGTQNIKWLIDVMQNVGFVCRDRPLIWFKTGHPGITDIYKAFLPAYESAIWAYKPDVNNDRRLFKIPVAEAYGYPRQANLWHESEKPVELLTHWIEASSEVNDVILDPFCGGGSVLVTAYQLARFFIGIEKDLATYDKCIKRLIELEKEGTLSDG